VIDEAIGKILGMAMAYGVSVLGLFLAYANYRRRIVRAEKVMTPAAWGVVAATLLLLVGAVAVVGSLVRPSAGAPVQVAAPAQAAAPLEVIPERTEPTERWPLAGMLLPAAIFLAATWITGRLYVHFAHGDHGAGAPAAHE